MARETTIEFYLDGVKYPSLADGFLHIARTYNLNKVGIKKILKREMLIFLNDVAKAMEAKHSGSYPAGTGPKSLSSRSGKGIKSIAKSVFVKGSSLEGTHGGIGGMSYLRTHEFGASIRPKNSKYLTVPLKAALDSRGLPKRPRARDWDRTFVNRTKKGNLLIFRRVGRRVVPLYLLVGPGEPISKIEFRKGRSPGAGGGPTRLGMREEIDGRLNNFTDKLALSILKEIGRSK